MLVPKLRFKEFTDEWKESELKKISSELIYGMNCSATDFDGTNKYIRITDINEETSLYNNSNLVSPLGRLENKYLVNENDILFARTGASTGKSYLYNSMNGKLYFAGFLIKAHINTDHNSRFIFEQFKLNKYKNWIKLMSMRSGQPGINANEYGSYVLSITSKNEENKIAETLELLDKKIELQTKKIEVLKIYKSCQLNQIFISNNLSECFLKDLAVIKKGQQINSDKLLKNGNYYMLNGGITLSGYLNEYNTENNTISISEGGNSCGYVNYNYQNFWSGGHCYTLTPININNEYLYHLLKNSEKLIMKLRIGTGLPNIQKKDLENVMIKRHKDIKIQEAIANAFMSFDLKIKLEADKLSLLKNMKKGLMQNMFV